MEESGKQLKVADQAFKAALECLSMRAQYFHDITNHGVEEARQMAFLVEKGHDAVHPEFYKTARHALTQKFEIKAAEQLAPTRLERATNPKKKKNGGQSASDTEYWHL